jgi:hypothetical protein
MAILIILIVLAMVAAVIAALVSGGMKGERGPTYQGQAPHKGPVMRFTGTSSQVKDDSGNQKTTQV